MMFWIAIALTILSAIYTAVVWIGNKGSLHNYMDPGADWWLVGVWGVVVVAWILASR